MDCMIFLPETASAVTMFARTRAAGCIHLKNPCRPHREPKFQAQPLAHIC